MKNCLKKFARIVFVAFAVLFCGAMNLPAQTGVSAENATTDYRLARDGCYKSFSINEVIPPEYLEVLEEKGMMEYIHEKGDEILYLMPHSSYANMVNSGRVKKERQSYVTESLYLVKKSTLVEKSKSGAKNVDTSINAVSRIFRSVSKMEGMKYYSISDKKTDVLYKRAYTFGSPEYRDPIPDQTTGNADGKVLYAYQHDKSFGDCYYKLSYFQNENELAAVFTTIDDMRIAGMNAVKKEQVKFNIIVMDCGDSYLVYIMLDGDCMWFPFIRERLTNSFRSRINAIYDWFIEQF